MKQLRIAVVLTILCCPTLLIACDACSNSGNQQLGILPQQGVHFVGIQYRCTQFSSRHASLFEAHPGATATEQYNSLQLWGRYYVGQRLQLFAFVPWQQSIATQQGIKSVQQGLGDVTIMAATRFSRNTGNLKHSLLISAGPKMPTGRYNGISQSDRNGLPNMQPGTGSWDVSMNANYTLQRQEWSMVAEASYLLTTANRYNYKYGNKTGVSVLGLRRLSSEQSTWLPFAGARLDYVLQDYDNYNRKWLNTASGGYITYASAGCQWYHNSIGAQLSAALPVSQHYADGNVQAKIKAEAGFFILFKNNK